MHTLTLILLGAIVAAFVLASAVGRLPWRFAEPARVGLHAAARLGLAVFFAWGAVALLRDPAPLRIALACLFVLLSLVSVLLTGLLVWAIPRLSRS
jgi:hypothetical protein